MSRPVGYRLGNRIRVNKDGTATIFTKKGFEILVDEADLPILRNYTWYAWASGNTRYAMTRGEDEMPFGMHTLLVYGVTRAHGKIVDHIDGNGLNNRRSNIRSASPRQNQANRKLSKNNTSGYRGVNFNKRYGNWKARIYTGGGAQKQLGTFATPEEAAVAYDMAAVQQYGEFAALNFPPDGAVRR